jgi:hypothetical protein
MLLLRECRPAYSGQEKQEEHAAHFFSSRVLRVEDEGEGKRREKKGTEETRKERKGRGGKMGEGGGKNEER